MISKLANLDVELAKLVFLVSNSLSETFLNFLEKVERTYSKKKTDTFFKLIDCFITLHRVFPILDYESLNFKIFNCYSVKTWFSCVCNFAVWKLRS